MLSRCKPATEIASLARQFLLLGCLLPLILTPGHAQDSKSKPAQPGPPNLSGEWSLDPSRSNLEKEIHDYSLTVVQHGSEIHFAKRYWRRKREVKEESTYYTDGRADIDPKMGINSKLETRWRGQKLVHKATTALNLSQSFDHQFVTYEEWTISNDGETLTRTTTTEAGSLLSRAVFKRVY